jgi:RNA polymerase sigma-70 factor (ECF subfamily)
VDRPPHDDVELAASARRGDLAAYSELVRRYREIAFRVAWLLCASTADAEDAAQEAFIRAYEALPRLREGAPFRPWLLTIVANQARNRRRAEGRRTHHELRAAVVVPGDAVPSPETAALAADRGRRLMTAVDGLPEHERVVVACRYLLELSEAETAAVMGIPPGTVKSRLSRAMARLRETVDGERDG